VADDTLDTPETEVEELDTSVFKSWARSIKPPPRSGSAAARIKKLAQEKNPKKVYVVSSDDPFVSEALHDIIPLLPGIIRDRRKKMTERELNALVDLLLPNDAMRDSLRAIALDNVELRKKFFNEWACLTSKDLHKIAGGRGKNTSLTASRWKKADRIFGLPVGRAEHFPGFQFRDGEPHPTISEVLGVFGETLTPWQTAFWFVAENSWLDGARPVDRLDRLEELLEAARHEVEDLRH